MGHDFPYVPLFRFFLVRQWIHARVSQALRGGPTGAVLGQV